MSDNAALYSYNGKELTRENIKQMNALTDIEPVLRAAAESLDFSWVYLTTADDWLLIYPYLPLKEAVHNVMPTNQVFYTAANFKDREVGWTLPAFVVHPNTKGQASPDDFANRVVDRVIAEMPDSSTSRSLSTEVQGTQVYAAMIDTTD